MAQGYGVGSAEKAQECSGGPRDCGSTTAFPATKASVRGGARFLATHGASASGGGAGIAPGAAVSWQASQGEPEESDLGTPGFDRPQIDRQTPSSEA